MVRLITGTSGMMGSHLYETLISQGKDVVPTFHNSTLPMLTNEEKIISEEMVELDILDYEKVGEVLDEVKPSVIYHLAAQSRPDVSFVNPILTFEINVMGTLHLLKACNELNLKPLFINASSSAVYGDIDWSTPPDEDHVCKPMSPYGSSKLAQENVVYNFYRMHDIPYVNVRIFNCTGPRKISDFISDLSGRYARGDNPLSVGNLNNFRSITDVRDMVRGLILCENIKNETINLGSDVAHNIGDMTKMIAPDVEYKIEDALLRPVDEHIIIGNVSKAKKLLGWKQEITLEQTIADTVDYWRNR